MEIKIVGTIEKLMPISRGVSAAGREWVKQDIVMSMTNGQFVKHLAATVLGQERIDNFKLRVGDNIVAYLDIDAREYNSRWYNSINIWRVERVGSNGNQTQSHQQQYEQETLQQPTNAGAQNNVNDLIF